MKSLTFAVLVCLFALANSEKEFDMARIMEAAEREALNELLSPRAHSPRLNRKKFTPTSRAMADRNNIFRKATAMLEAEGATNEEARVAVRKEMRKGTRQVVYSGGQFGLTEAVPIIDDACGGTVPTCDADQFFPNINQQCNNLANPLWGSSVISLRRFINGIPGLDTIHTYTVTAKDFVASKGTVDPMRSVGGGAFGNFGIPAHKCASQCGGPALTNTACIDVTPDELPNPRLISSNYHLDRDIPAKGINHMLTQFGQFLDHDVTLSPEYEIHDCCDHPEFAECLPIDVPENDPFYSLHNVTCHEFTRSVLFCEDQVELDFPEQFNAITAFVDASNVYGSDDTTSAFLRANDGTGKLLVDGNNLLPELDGQRQAGDVRAREMPGLAAMHTLFVREHNRIVDQLVAFAPDRTFTEDELFDNARRILIAEMQNIVFGEYLPIVLGPDAMREYDLNLATDSIYSSEIDPSIEQSFGTAAFRFGHSMIQGLIQMFSLNARPSLEQEYLLRNNFFNMTNYELDDGLGMDQIIQGLVNQVAQTSDQFMTEEITNFLFREEGHDFGQDLMTRNIQRARDHSIPGFAAHYYVFGNQDDPNRNMDCWDQRPETIPEDIWNQLQAIYYHPHHIDLWVGGFAEIPVKGALTGRVFNTIKARQFGALKAGDRHFFTHAGQPFSWSKAAQEHLMTRRLSDIICENTDIRRVAGNAFLERTNDNRYVRCNQSGSRGVNRLDLSVLDLPIFRA